jgi:hypothetical protein
LNAVVDAVRIPFAENGLSYSQFPVMDDNRVGVETILMHESGEFIASTLMLPTGKLDAQAAGSAITYARRYSLQAIAGIPAEDDDGNAATQGTQQARKPKSQPQNNSAGVLKSFTAVISSCTTSQACAMAKDKFFKVPTNKMTAEDNKKAKAVYQTHYNDLETQGL